MIEILIDGDEIAYKSSAPSSVWKLEMKLYRYKKSVPADATNVVGLQIQPHFATVEAQLKAMVNKICTRVPLLIGDYQEDTVKTTLFISGPTNFRKVRHESYKANRANKRKPFYLDKAKDLISRYYTTVKSVDEEADDVISYTHESLKKKGKISVIASSDKDFLTCPGYVYNIIQDKLSLITVQEAYYNFYKQVLTGDKADGVTGIFGVGPVKAERILKGLVTEEEMYDAVLEEYKRHGLSAEEFEKNAFLLHLRKEPGEIWKLR